MVFSTSVFVTTTLNADYAVLSKLYTGQSFLLAFGQFDDSATTKLFIKRSCRLSTAPSSRMVHFRAKYIT